MRRALLVAFCLTAAHGALDVKSTIKEAQADLEANRPTWARSKLKAALSELREMEKSEELAQDAADLLIELGGTYRQLSQEAEAIAAFEEAADILTQLHGADDGRHTMALSKLADAHASAGAHAEALPLYRAMLTSMRKRLGQTHPGYSWTLDRLAHSAMGAGKPKAAAKALKQLLELAGTTPAPDSIADASQIRASMQLRYSTALANSGKLVEALEQAEAAEAGFAASGSEGSLEHAQSINGVAGVLEKLGRDDDAIAAMTRAHDLVQGSEDESVVRGAQRNLAGLQAHVRRKRERQAQGQAQDTREL